MLSYLALRADGGVLPSERIALSVNTNPAVVRRLLMQLSAAGMTSSQLGTGGGARLARSPEDIQLLEVYEAVEDVSVFALHRSPPNPKCMVGRNITTVLKGIAEEAENAVREVLGRKTIADVAKAVLKQEGRRTAAKPASVARAS